MTADERDLTFVETTPADDVIGGRAPRRPAAQWLRGRFKAASDAPTPAPTGSVLTELPRLHTTGSVCSTQLEGTRQLMLGVEVQNSGLVPIQLRAVRGSFPLGLLRMQNAAVGDCDNPGIPVLGSWVGAGASTWLRLTVDVLAHCPTWAPVEFQVDYTVNGALASLSLAGFPDLGGVAYSGC